MAVTKAVAYTAEQAILLSHHENDVIKSITGTIPTGTPLSRTSTTKNIVPLIIPNNDNLAALINLNKKLYEAPNINVDTTYTWLLECLQKDRIGVEYVPKASMKIDGMTTPLGRIKNA